MSSGRALFAAGALSLASCKPSLPARTTEIPFPASSTVCADSFLLYLDPDNCDWRRVDGATGREAVVVAGDGYCSASGISVHPTEPRLFAHLLPDADTKPDILRELSVAESKLRSVAVPLETYVEYSGYDEKGRMTIVVAEEIAEPGRAMTMVNDLFGRESCAMESARAYVHAGNRWALAREEVAELCGDPAPTDELNSSVLAPSTMIGTTTLVTLPRVTDPGVLATMRAAMGDGDEEEAPVWREKTTEWGRILRGSNDYGDSFWIAFVDTQGKVLGKPVYDDNVKLRLRGKYLLTTLDSEENARLYDVSTGALVWEAPTYSTTVFWPCPG
jgi:hypothetical protein